MAGAGALPGVTGLVLGGAYRLSDAGLEKVWMWKGVAKECETGEWGLGKMWKGGRGRSVRLEAGEGVEGWGGKG